MQRRGGHFLSMARGAVGLHSQIERREYEQASRREAERTRKYLREAQASGVFGRGRLATIDDARDYGLLDANGLYLGAFDERLLFFNGDSHLLTYMRNGAGKGRDIILPNLGHVRDRSLVVIDVKDGENCFASHAFREGTLGQKCIYLNPFGLLGLPNTRINPLQTLIDIIARGEEIDTQAEEIAQILLPASPKETDSSWVRKGAVRLLTVRMEYLALFDPENCNLAGLWRFVNASDDEMGLTFSMMESCGVESIARRAASLSATMREAPKQFEAYKSDAIEAVAPFAPEKTLARATSAHEFDFARLKHEACTVYLIAPSEKLTVVAPWISLLVNVIIETIAKEYGPLRTCFLLDEFPQLPPAPAVMKALRLYRGKGIQLWIFSQGRFSMEGRWSRDAVKEFEDQAAVLNSSAIEDISLLSDFERWSGNMTVLTHGINRSGGAVESAGANLGEAKRSVLQSEDIRAIGDGRQIIRLAGLPHLMVCDRVPYFKVSPWAEHLRDVRDLHKGIAT